MTVIKFSNKFDFEIQDNAILFNDNISKEDKFKYIPKDDKVLLCKTNDINDEIIACIDDKTFIYAWNGHIYADSQEIKDSIFNYEVIINKCLDIQIANRHIGEFYLEGKLLFTLNDLFSEKNDTKTIVYTHDFDLGIESERQRYITIAKLKFNNLVVIITYDRFLNEIIYRKFIFKLHYQNENFSLRMINSNNIELTNKENDDSVILNVNKIGLSPTLIRELRMTEKIKKEHILLYFSFKNRKYFIFNNSNGVHVLRSNPKLISRYTSLLLPFKLKKSFYLIGRFKHNGYRAKHKYDYIYLQDKDNKVGKFKRPFKNLKVLNQFVVGKVPFEEIEKLDRIHTNILCGSEDFVLHNVGLSSLAKPMQTLKSSVFKDNVMILRNNLGANLTLTSIPYSEEYSMSNKIKIKVAKLFSKKNKNKNTNIYFEKKSERAEESSIKVFDKVMENKNINSNNYFILDKNASYFKEMKKKYGKFLLKKYSFKHYLKLYESDYFVSSELPNHIINDRIYIDSLRDKIMDTPSVFLQHGIMFAKPVDNPMAFGFHKNYNKYNNIKNVISSDLEAEQFYKMGYDDNDLIKTGLATFDNITLSEGADKIAYMPTYRYWEERLIYSGDITKTSYFRSLIKVINEFEKAGLKDRLLVVPHNKFSEYIYDKLPEYKEMIEPNPSEALKDSIIFITDYSSAIYDSIYRGAYPIFYWEEKDYLIENYKAIPPVNDNNAPGEIAYSAESLVNIVQKAIANNYKVPENIMHKYRQINEFQDNKNTDRIIDELKKLEIL
ncbi:CDP-glycerol glycerophosphotransferase family protein [Mammaliicoccus sp. Dog046]|uniref:CDP-glycerol glycerophosphotransferase family protein n=1 Tax=Mammaliicoccus sp. Dog046 TaxID=3034233 RepID=UPI002B25EF58|nr:CDP-glycerol glycerophosphotransferase family protein [Mammaliicoccus sp. Dog046]WQK85140.1 CDP-glycerol glycerophosphotransferase family protein [Mammaliicoccus sp. Dog046]